MESGAYTGQDGGALNCTIIYDITFERSHTSTINFRLVVQNTILSIKLTNHIQQNWSICQL